MSERDLKIQLESLALAIQGSVSQRTQAAVPVWIETRNKTVPKARNLKKTQ